MLKFPSFFVSIAVFLMALKYTVFVLAVSSVWRDFIIYHVFAFLMVWCYWKAMFTHAGTWKREDFTENVEDDSLLRQEYGENEDNEANADVESEGVCSKESTEIVRWCEKCDLPKPKSVHHCSTCKECILEMDHHCPWTNNCVGRRNKKFFILFLLYTSFCCLFMSIVSYKSIFVGNDSTIKNGQGVTSIAQLTWCLAVSIGTLLLMFFFFHLWLIFSRRTTLEFLKGKKESKEQGGFSSVLFLEHFGNNCLFWWVPVHTMGTISSLKDLPKV